MSNHHDRKPSAGHGATIASLVAVVACALAGDALARQSPVEPSAEPELAARVAAIAERIRSAEPTLVRELPPEVKIAQWRNR
jgi:hypothetical protein